MIGGSGIDCDGIFFNFKNKKDIDVYTDPRYKDNADFILATINSTIVYKMNVVNKDCRYAPGGVYKFRGLYVVPKNYDDYMMYFLVNHEGDSRRKFESYLEIK